MEGFDLNVDISNNLWILSAEIMENIDHRNKKKKSAKVNTQNMMKVPPLSGVLNSESFRESMEVERMFTLNIWGNFFVIVLNSYNTMDSLGIQVARNFRTLRVTDGRWSGTHIL